MKTLNIENPIPKIGRFQNGFIAAEPKCWALKVTRILGRYAPFILGMPAGFSCAHAMGHVARFSCRAREVLFRSLLMTCTQGILV